MSRASARKKGFTLVELLLAMSFISFLLVAIALTVIQISNIYNRGVTIKDVNQVGRALADDFERTVAASAPFDPNPAAGRFVPQSNYGGRLCLGTYTYIWNYGQAIEAGNTSNLNTFSDSSQVINLIKVSDPSRQFCQDLSARPSVNGSVELLVAGERNLAIHNLSIYSSPTAFDPATNQRLYSIDFLIGTNDQQALEYSPVSGTVCKPPSEAESDITYCAVNEFTIVVRAGNMLD